jgi:single-strand DNA-binding protein
LQTHSCVLAACTINRAEVLPQVSSMNEYKTRTEWHRVISWNKLAEWAGTLQKGAYIEVEGELRYREFTPVESDRSVRVAEIHASSILALNRSDRQPVSTPESEAADESVD